jgi:hypothetical protein
MHIGEEVGQLASQKIWHVSQRFCEAWPSNQTQLKSCSLLNGKALSSTMDCSRLCTAAAGHLEIVVLEFGTATDNFAPASGTIAVRQVMMLSVPMDPRSPVLNTVLCTNESRPARGQREWNPPLTFFHKDCRKSVDTLILILIHYSSSSVRSVSLPGGGRGWGHGFFLALPTNARILCLYSL